MATPPAPSGEPRFELSRDAVLPLFGNRATWSQEHLLPIVLTVLVGVSLIAVPIPGIQLNAKTEINEAWQVYLILAFYIAILVNYYIHQMCGRAKPWWLIALVALFTFCMLGTPAWNNWFKLFYDVLPAAQWQKSPHVLVRLAGWWFGTGLCEEGFKAWPLLGLALIGGGLGYLGRHTAVQPNKALAKFRKRFGLLEPLDGIVLGVGSGSGFFLAETLLQYVPGVMSHEKYPGSQAFDGLVLLLGRGLPEIAEHSAWCGLFGYFIGLAVLQPRMAKYLLPFGWLSAAALHASWDGIDAVTNFNLFVFIWLITVGVLSYALLAGAIFKAREISPTLASNLATAAALAAAGPSGDRSSPSPSPLAEAEGSDGD
jgi:RsiW-degrading membrane proteinase PrsW (M82 family)